LTDKLLFFIRVLERGERINLLVSKTDRMNNNSLVFRKRAANVQRSMWWKNVKMTVLFIFVFIVVIYFVLGMVCGLPFYASCIRR
jgi:vesicle-associated membrane protein 7